MVPSRRKILVSSKKFRRPSKWATMTVSASPGAAANLSNGIYQVGGVARTKQRHGIPVYFRYAHNILGVFNKVRIPFKVINDIAYAAFPNRSNASPARRESTCQRAVGRY